MKKIRLILPLFLSFLLPCYCFHLHPMRCNVSLASSCPAALYYVPQQPKSITETSALFRVPTSGIGKTADGFLIGVSCSCLAEHDEFIWHVYYTVEAGETWETVSQKFGLLVAEMPEKTLLATMNITLDILCGCVKGFQMTTYTIQPGDTLYIISLKFDVGMEEIRKVNNITDASFIEAGDKIFIPTSEDAIGQLIVHDEDSNMNRSSKRSKLVPLILAIVAGGALIVLIAILVWIYYLKSKKRKQSGKFPSKNNKSQLTNSAPSAGKNSSMRDHFHAKDSRSSSSSFQSSIRATVFPYSEVSDATNNFNVSRKVGQGSYGSVYRGNLRGVDVAVKQMKKNKSKEFFAELNVLCKVYHHNLIELIGYSAGAESLFLVYEFAHNGALSDHLRNPSAKGHRPLSWQKRLQIALDVAKGLEYIHSFVKPFCVHRDVKTSNILLDSNFRAKISDFGLVKLLEHSPEVGAETSKVVGTFGYLSPEYIRDGCVSTKNDVYAYGVVLMELITGQPALKKRTRVGDSFSQHQSLVDIMLLTLESGHDRMTKLVEIVDPHLTQYHNESLLQMALLSKDCVNDEWKRRPNMSQVLLCLSLIARSMNKAGSGVFAAD